MSEILNDIKQSFRQGSNLTRVIYINLAFFIVVNLVSSLSFLFASRGPEVLTWLALPAYLPSLIVKPWTLLSYMFLHEGFLHILFNMLWLYFGGRIFQDLLGEKRFINAYIMGGLSGGILYILAFNLFPVFSDVLPQARALGASASVMAIIVAIATKVPDYVVRLIFLGNIKLKYIAIFFVVLNLITFQDGNAGGNIAHLGGAAFGFFYIRQLNRGYDWSLWFSKWVGALGSLFLSQQKKKVRVVYRKSSRKEGRKPRDHQAMIDSILDKISRSGYDSLSKEEKDILFKASQNN